MYDLIFQFNIDDTLIRKSLDILQTFIQDRNHDYLKFDTPREFKESRLQREVDFITESEPRKHVRLFREEIALRLHYFHDYVGNTDDLRGVRTYHIVDFEPPFDPMDFIKTYIMDLAREYFEGANDINRLVRKVGNIFIYSQLFVLPFPHQVHQIDSNKQQESELSQRGNIQNYITVNPSIFDSNRIPAYAIANGFIESYRYLKPIVVDENNEYTESVRLHRIMRIFPPTPTLDLIRFDKALSYNVVNGILYPVIDLVNSSFRAEMFAQDDKILNPDYCIRARVRDSVFSIPVDMKFIGLFEAFNKRNSDFSQITNQYIYQMLQYRSSIGFLFDKESIMIIKLFNREIPELEVDELTQMRLANLKCNIQCLRYTECSPALVVYRHILSYLQNVTEEDRDRLHSIFKIMRMTPEEKGKVLFAINKFKNSTEYIDNLQALNVSYDGY
ncbi:hypothetical protein DFJ63DRAFT_310181 [Scheffersomyces coipomensis]|uniref:uncharacterized protein n=1 Tax=Scheffersomyces coipomensis TaxID=1788519 RepID=UPI00315CC3E8